MIPFFIRCVTRIATNPDSVCFAGRLLAELSKISKFPHLPYVIPDRASCAPRPVVVEVPRPVHESTLYFPFFVTMYRCGGNCNARDDTICRPLGRFEKWLL